MAHMYILSIYIRSYSDNIEKREENKPPPTPKKSNQIEIT